MCGPEPDRNEAHIERHRKLQPSYVPLKSHVMERLWGKLYKTKTYKCLMLSGWPDVRKGQPVSWEYWR